MAQAFKHEYRETLPTRRAELVANLKRMAIAKPGVEFVIDAHARTPDGNRDRVIADVAAIMREAGFAVRIAGPAIELGGPKLTPVAVRTPQAHRDLVIMLINGVFDPATRIVVSSQGAPEREIWMRISGVPAFLPDGRVRIEPES